MGGLDLAKRHLVAARPLGPAVPLEVVEAEACSADNNNLRVLDHLDSKIRHLVPRLHLSEHHLDSGRQHLALDRQIQRLAHPPRYSAPLPLLLVHLLLGLVGVLARPLHLLVPLLPHLVRRLPHSEVPPSSVALRHRRLSLGTTLAELSVLLPLTRVSLCSGRLLRSG